MPARFPGRNEKGEKLGTGYSQMRKPGCYLVVSETKCNAIASYLCVCVGSEYSRNALRHCKHIRVIPISLYGGLP